MTMCNPAELRKALDDLRLRHFAKAMDADLAEVPPAERERVLTLLSRWSRLELAERRSASIQGRIRAARFLKLQTVEQFNFEYSQYSRKHRTPYISLYDSVDSDELPSAVFIGGPGVGKTHLSRALGYRACQLNLSVLFITAAEMVNHLEQAKKAGYLDSEFRKYRKPQVLIVDELGYVSMDAQASNLFFQVISTRHDQGLGTITTTNLAFGKWNQIFANDAIAHVIVDRLTSEAEVFYMEGPSYRPHERDIRRSRRQDKAKTRSRG